MKDINGDPVVDKDGEKFVEVDPTGRYGRYRQLLGTGSTKKVYRGFDREKGREIAWNKVCLRPFIDNEVMINRLYNEVHILKSLKHNNVIEVCKDWTDEKNFTLNFITEICSSGNLRDFRLKHRQASMVAIKNWCQHILRGLKYLHEHEPCIIHRDLTTSNVFINGNNGEIKIGDLGFAIESIHHEAHSVVGTPEFMAPELYEEKYTEAVDIYSFGMCLLELVTMEIPYLECDSIAKVYKKVTTGVKPKALSKVTNPEVKAFIERCLVKDSERPSASELLKDPFFDELQDVN